MTIIDAHSHLWLRQDAVVDGQHIEAMPGGRARFFGEERQMLPPFLIDGRNSAEVFLSNMNYAQVGAAVVVQEIIDGNQDAYLREVQARYPDRFLCCALLDIDRGGLMVPDGWRAAAIPGHRMKRALDSPEMISAFRELERRGIILSMCLADDGRQIAQFATVVQECPRLKVAIGQAREYGFTRGAYHFYSVHSPAKAQAEFFIQNVKLENGDLPPVLDVEHKPKSQTDEAFKESVLLWLNMVESHYGVKPIIYTYYKFKTRYLSDSVFDSYPYWIAHYYVEKVEYTGAWKFWQHTDVGKLPGIKGNVDFDIYNGSYYDLRKMTIGAREHIGEEAYSD